MSGAPARTAPAILGGSRPMRECGGATTSQNKTAHVRDHVLTDQPGACVGRASRRH